MRGSEESQVSNVPSGKMLASMLSFVIVILKRNQSPVVNTASF